MLFHVTWDFIDSSETGQKRCLKSEFRSHPSPRP